jgi:hypothetical protein
MKLMAIAVAMALALPATAQVVKRSEGYPANCTDATEREDGTPLLASEIANVWYYLDKTYGDVDTATKSILMSGGCKDTYVDTKQMPVGDYHRYAITVDTDGEPSRVSDQLPEVLTIQNAKPKAPGNIK